MPSKCRRCRQNTSMQTKSQRCCKMTTKSQKARQKEINARKSLVRRMGVDPDNGWDADWQIIPEKEKVLKALKKAAKNVDNIYLATDLDREGEAIGWHLYDYFKIKKYERILFTEITKKDVIKAIEKTSK